MKKLAGIILILSILSPFAFFIGFFAPSYSNAQQGATDGKPNAYTSLAPLDSKLNTINLTSATALSDYLNAIVKFLIIAAGFFAVLMIVLGGIQYMSTDIVDKKSEGKEKLKSAVFGLILALVAVLFLQTINPQLLSTTLKVEPQTIKSGGSVDGDPTNGVTGGTPGSYTSLAPLNSDTATIDLTKNDALDKYLNNLFKIGIGLAAAFAIIMMVLGGIQYMSTDAISGKGEGRDKIVSALWGLLLALAAVLILQTINPQLLSTTLEVPKQSVSSGAGADGDPTNGASGGNAGSYTSLAPLNSETETIDLTKNDALDKYLNNFFKIGIGLAVAFAVLMIVIGGIQYMSTDAISGKGEGRDKIVSALWGLLLALAAVLILQVINPQLLSTKLEVQKINIEVALGNVPVRVSPEGYTSPSPLPPPPASVPADGTYNPSFGAPYSLNGTRTTYYFAGEKYSDPDTDAFRSATGPALRYGNKDTVGVVAVDPRVIPLGSIVALNYPDGTHYFVAVDVGGGVKGNHIDFFSTTAPGNGNDYQNVAIYPYTGSSYRGLKKSQQERFFNSQIYGDFNAPDNGPGTPGAGATEKGDTVSNTYPPSTDGTVSNGATGGKVDQYVPLAPLPGGETTIDLTKNDALDKYLNNLFKIGIGLAAAFAIIMMVLGGIQYMSTDAISGKGEGRDKIVSALWGLLLALAAVLILQTINPQLLSTSLKVEPQTIKSGGSVDGDPTNGATGGNPQSYAPLVDLPGFSGTVKVDNLDVYLNTLFKLGIGLAAAFAIIMIVIGGIQYYSTDVVSGKSEGKERIKGAILGLILALLGVLILQTINPQLLSTKLEVPLIDVQGIEVFVEGDPGDDTLPNVDPIQKNPPVVPTVNNVCEKEQKQISTLQEYINCGCFAAKDHSGRAGQVSPIVAYVKANLGSMFPGKPVTVVSDFRSVEHNHNVGGASKSDHLTGNAIDIGDGNSRMNEALANEIVSYFQSHGEYGATKIIYNKILYKAGGSQAASDHIDHVHVSFAPVASCN